jgi:signal peptidase II
MISKKNSIALILIIINIAADQISKFWIRANIDAGSISEIIGKNFTLHNVENTGAFLGMGSDLGEPWRTILLLVLPVAVLIVVIYHVFKEKHMDWFTLIGFSCILGGGIANIYDRIALGSVTDFWRIDLGGIFKTGIFNVADLSVSIGMILLLISTFFIKKVENS